MFSSLNPPGSSLPPISGLIFILRGKKEFSESGRAAESSDRRGVPRGLKSRRDGDCQQNSDSPCVCQKRMPLAPLGVRHYNGALGGSGTQTMLAVAPWRSRESVTRTERLQAGKARLSFLSSTALGIHRASAHMVRALSNDSLPGQPRRDEHSGQTPQSRGAPRRRSKGGDRRARHCSPLWLHKS